jgi:hypothetical protein
MAGIATLTDRNAVLKAMAEYDRRGRDAFLEHYRAAALMPLVLRGIRITCVCNFSPKGSQLRP